MPKAGTGQSGCWITIKGGRRIFIKPKGVGRSIPDEEFGRLRQERQAGERIRKWKEEPKKRK